VYPRPAWVIYATLLSEYTVTQPGSATAAAAAMQQTTHSFLWGFFIFEMEAPTAAAEQAFFVYKNFINEINQIII
jgi:hypothetical protein